MAEFNQAELLPYYLDEADENVAGLDDALLRLERDPSDARALADAFRMFHSIKGTSIVMGFEGVHRLTHVLESLFDQLRNRRRTLDRPALDLTFRCLDGLRDYHRELRRDGRGGRDLSGLIREVDAALAAPPRAPAAPPPPPDPRPGGDATASEGLGAAVRVAVRFEPGLPLADMKARLVAERLASKGRVVATEPPLDRLDGAEDLATFVAWVADAADPEELRALADVDGAAGVVVGPAAGAGPPAPEAPPPEAPARRARVAETVRVDSDRLDDLMNLAGELVISKARFVDVARGLDEALRGADALGIAAETEERLEAVLRGLDAAVDRRAGHVRRLREDFRAIRGELGRIRRARERLKALGDAIHGLGHVADGLQKRVLETRMVPIGPLFERFRRVVRDLGVASGKEVALEIGGGDTELDKRMIDELSDPLIHMVRNAVDHGLEVPGDREAAGKPRAGTVTLRASHRGNRVVVTVADDGRGIDCGRLREKVVSRGLVGRDEAAGMADRELIPFIWHPGLSTAEAVTEISGRGVGMDIVKERIDGLSGGVDVRSTPGAGTVFTIRLPLTLAIMSSLLVRIYDEVYALPLEHIDEIVEVRGDRIGRVQGRPTVEIRGRFLALTTLGDLFRWGGGAHPSAPDPPRFGDPSESFRVAIVRDGETAVGLVVDELIGMQEVVLKSLERNYRPVAGLSGASILGDGRVSLILDVDAVIAAASSGPGALA